MAPQGLEEWRLAAAVSYLPLRNPLVFFILFAYTVLCQPAAALSPLLIQIVQHSVEVSAATVYEACVLGMAEFRKCGFAEINFGPATILGVSVKAPATAHLVSIQKVQGWLSQVRSPREQIERARLRSLLTDQES